MSCFFSLVMSYLTYESRPPLEPPQKTKVHDASTQSRQSLSVSRSKLIKLPISSHTNTMFFPPPLLSSLMIHLSLVPIFLLSPFYSAFYSSLFPSHFFLPHPHISLVSFISLSPVFPSTTPMLQKFSFSFYHAGKLVQNVHQCVCPWPSAALTFLVRSWVCGGGHVRGTKRQQLQCNELSGNLMSNTFC